MAATVTSLPPSAFRLTFRVEHLHPWHTRIHACRRPDLAAGRENVTMSWHVGSEIVDADAAAFDARRGNVDDVMLLEIDTHGVDPMIKSLKSVSGCFGLSRVTMRPARLQRSAQRAAAVCPSPLRS